MSANLFQRAEITESAFGFPASGLAGPTLLHELVRLHFKVKTQLVSYVGGWIRAEEALVTPPKRR
jgi:predicted component of type VI protein secretion system